VNRTIRFRGKWIVDNQWVYGGFFMRRLTSSPTIATDTGMWLPVFPDTVGQFIEIYDKSGKEIYTGDIVKGYFKTIEDVLTEEEKRTETHIFKVDNIHFGYEYPIPEVLEVIGNVWDTPELMIDKGKE
jgi:hypothetical protein